METKEAVEVNVLTDLPVDPEERRNFSRDAYEFLKAVGVDNRMRRSRIFKAAGPGQVRAAWELANCEEWESPEGQERKDLLICLLQGAVKITYGWKRMERVLEMSGFPVPKAHSGRCFFRTLSGAREILEPGSYRFSREEMQEIKDGLRKRIQGDEEQEG